MSEQDDALAVARWRWPDIRLVYRADLRMVVEWGLISFTREELDESAGLMWNPNDQQCIADAEQVVLARGLAEQYGRALIIEGEMDAYDLLNGVDHSLDQVYALVSSAATAPLDSRLRALAKVARENTNWSGHPVDVAKALLRDMGETISPEAEAAMRAACDEMTRRVGKNP